MREERPTVLFAPCLVLREDDAEVPVDSLACYKVAVARKPEVVDIAVVEGQIAVGIVAGRGNMAEMGSVDNGPVHVAGSRSVVAGIVEDCNAAVEEYIADTEDSVDIAGVVEVGIKVAGSRTAADCSDCLVQTGLDLNFGLAEAVGAWSCWLGRDTSK